MIYCLKKFLSWIDRFTTIEDNLAAASVLNSTLQSQRDRFNAFLQDLADALKLTDADTARDLEVNIGKAHETF